MMAKVTNRRPHGCRKKWIKISARFINGQTDDLAQFNRKYPGDANLYLKRLQDGDTVEEIFID